MSDVVCLEAGVFHRFDCPELVHGVHSMSEEVALHNWPMARWHSCCFTAHRRHLDGDTCLVCGNYWPCVTYTDSLGI